MNIKNIEVERLVSELARLTGESKTEAVRKALEERAERVRLRVPSRRHAANFRSFLEREIWPKVPKRQLGRRLSRREEDEILGYGPEGA